MLAVIMFFLLGQATDPGVTYWLCFWVFTFWEAIESISRIYKAGKEARG